jgi:site-specific recombinase XerD
MTHATIKIEPLQHRDKNCIALRFDYNRDIIDKVKTIEGARWSATNKCWYMPAVADFREIVEKTIGDFGMLEFKGGANLPINSDIADSYRKQVASEKMKGLIEVYCDERQKTFYLNLPFQFKDEFKKLEGAWWHPGARIWSALDTNDNRAQLKEIFNASDSNLVFKTRTPSGKKLANNPKLTNPVQPEKDFLRHMQLEKKSPHTIKQYNWYVVWFLTVNRAKDILHSPGELVMKFLHEEIYGRGYGSSSQNQALSAIKYYYKFVHHIDLDAENIPRPKRKRILPKVIAEEEFVAMYRQCHYLKHQIILKLLYGCGLRRAELCDLRVKDVDFKRGLIYVKGKGSKYRALNPGTRLLCDIEKYVKSFLPKEYLIEGQNGGNYSSTSVGKVVKRVAEKAGLKQAVSPHMLRHTFATHHMEQGTDLRLIQAALGHASSKTTEIYTHVSRKSIKNMRNLLDDMDI